MRAVLLVALLVGSTASGAPAVDAEIDRYVEAEMRLNRIPGLALVMVAKGEIAYLRAYGYRRVNSGQAVRPETPMELASLSKALTALAVLRLEREGLLDRASSVAAYLPELREPAWATASVNDLLRHRSGLRRRHDFRTPCCAQPDALDLREAARRLNGADLQDSPGGAFSYANSNYVLLAAIAERLGELPFPESMRERVFVPLGLRNAAVGGTRGHQRQPALPHEWQWGRVQVSPSRFLGWPGASLIRASATDLGAFLLFLLNPERSPVGAKFLGPDWWRSLAASYDLGWFALPAADWLDGQFVLEHTGKLWGASTAAALVPDRRFGVAVLANLGTERAGPIARAMLRRLAGTPLPAPQQANRAEIPDTWAAGFALSAAVFFVATAVYAWSGWRQFRSGKRVWHPVGWRCGRAAILAALAAGLWLRLFRGSGPPLAALPTTVGLALPVLAASVTGILLVTAALGLLPRLRLPNVRHGK